MWSYWLNVEVLKPSSLSGRIAKIRSEPETLIPTVLGEEGDSIQSEQDENEPIFYRGRNLGRADLVELFGDFPGSDRISKKHFEIRVNASDPRKFIVQDLDSMNGTRFLEGTHEGPEVTVELGGEITLKLSTFEGQLYWHALDGYSSTISYTENEISETPPPPPLKLETDEDVMGYITSEVKNCSEKLDMKWFIRRKWEVRETPVWESKISDYQWKLVPKLDKDQDGNVLTNPNGEPYAPQSGWEYIDNNPEFDPKNPEFRTFEGAYYLLEVNADDLVFEHSGHIGGMILDYDKSSTGWNERHCVIAQYAVNPRGSQFHPGKLAGWLERQIAKYPPNWFSVT